MYTCICFLKKIFVSMSTLLIQLPNDLLDTISQYIHHPADYFAARSTARTFIEILKPYYCFTGIDQVIHAFARPTKYYARISNIICNFTLNHVAIEHMLSNWVPGTVVMALLADCGDINTMSEAVAPLNTSLFLELVMASIYYGEYMNDLVINSRPPITLHFVGCELVSFSLNIASDEVCLNMLKAYGSLCTNEDCHRPILYTAIDRRLYRSTEWLLKQNIVPLNTSHEGTYLLQKAIKSGCCDIVSLLCKFGATVNCRYRNGHLPILHTACMARGMQILDVVLSQKCDVTVRDFTGRTAFQLLKNSIRKLESSRQCSFQSAIALYEMRQKLSMLNVVALQESRKY